MKILVVEDDADIRSFLQVAIGSLGHEAIAAPDGLEGWRLFESQGADAIVSDWRMPGLMGTDLCKRVRESPGPYVYFVLLTALEGEGHMLHGMMAGSVRRFAEDRNTRSAKYYRVLNEVPTVGLVLIVILVVVKPF